MTSKFAYNFIRPSSSLAFSIRFPMTIVRFINYIYKKTLHFLRRLLPSFGNCVASPLFLPCVLMRFYMHVVADPALDSGDNA